MKRVRLSNGIEIELRVKGAIFEGLGEAAYRGMALRDGTRPIRPFFETPEGIAYETFRHPEVTRKGEAVLLRVKAVGRHGRLTDQYESHWGKVRTAESYLRPDEEVEDVLEIELAPKTLRIEEVDFIGFVTRYRFAGRGGRKVRRFEECATWEIGGSCTDNTIINRIYYTPFAPEAKLGRNTEWHTGGETPGATFGGWAYQYSLRWGGSIGLFDFLASPKGTLIRGYEKPAFLRSWLCKKKGETVLACFDEQFDTLSSRFETVGTFVGFTPKHTSKDVTAMRNLWTACHIHFTEAARQWAGAKPNTIVPFAACDWMKGETSGRTLYEYADKYLPGLAEMAFKVVWLGPLWNNDRSTEGVEESSCSAWDWEISPIYGGMEGLRYFTRKAHDLGLLAIIWVSGIMIGQFHRAFLEHRRNWNNRYNNRRQFGSGYDGMGTFNLRRPEVYEWVIGRLKKVMEEGGVDGYFLDSHVDSLLEPIDASDGTYTPQFEQGVRFTVELQKHCKYLCAESQSPFALIQVGNGIAGMKPVEGLEYINYDRHFGAIDYLTSKDWLDGYYRNYAYGGNTPFSFRIFDKVMADRKWFDSIRQTHLDTMAARPYMAKRRLLPGDPGVEWTSADRRHVVYFSFEKGAYKAPKKPLQARCLTTGEACALAADGRLAVEPRKTYLLAL